MKNFDWDMLEKRVKKGSWLGMGGGFHFMRRDEKARYGKGRGAYSGKESKTQRKMRRKAESNRPTRSTARVWHP